MAGRYSQLEGGSAPRAEPTVNPFCYRPKMTALDWIKVIVNTFWLLPLRLLLLVIPSFALGVLCCVLAILGDTLDEDNPRPLRGWRRFLINDIGCRLDRVLLFGLGFHWIKVRGRPASAAEAPIMVASPHSSILDMCIISLFHLPTFVAKREARSVFFLGHLVTHTMRTIYVARDDPGSRRRCTDEILRRARDSEAGWPKILIFPEATVHSREVLLQFKKGAFLPGVPVQAVAVKYQNRSNTMVWAEKGISAITSLYLTICQFHNKLEVEFLPVHHPTAEEVASPELFAESVRRAVSKATGIPISDYSVEDMLVCRRAERLGLPFSSGLVLFPTLHHQLQLTLPQVKLWLLKFSKMDADKDGFVTFHDFCHFLVVPSDACSQAVFSALTETGSATSRLSFRQYLHGVVRNALPFATDQALLEMFQFFDTNKAGVITLSDIASHLPVQWTDSNCQGTPPNCGCGYQQHCHSQQVPLPLSMSYDQFCCSVRENMEYLLLFHECQRAALSSPSSSQKNGSLATVAEGVAIAVES